MNTIPVPFPGRHVADLMPDGGWESNGRNFEDLPRCVGDETVKGCAILAPEPYSLWSCAQSFDEPHDWHIATMTGWYVVAVWPDPVERAHAALLGRQTAVREWVETGQ